MISKALLIFCYSDSTIFITKCVIRIYLRFTVLMILFPKACLQASVEQCTHDTRNSAVVMRQAPCLLPLLPPQHLHSQCLALMEILGAARSLHPQLDTLVSHQLYDCKQERKQFLLNVNYIQEGGPLLRTSVISQHLVQTAIISPLI